MSYSQVNILYILYYYQDVYLPVIVQNSGNDAVIENVPQVCLLVLTINVPIPAVSAQWQENTNCCYYLQPT